VPRHPGQIVEFVDAEHHIAKAEVSGLRRSVNVGLLAGEVETGDSVLIQVGFALSKSTRRKRVRHAGSSSSSATPTSRSSPS
jgi:hydrogenase expression/formation protein HypC